MAHRCQISKSSHQVGNRVSHANNKTKHVFLTNIQTKRIFVPELKKFVRVKLSTQTLRTIDKIGLTATLKKYKMTVADLA